MKRQTVEEVGRRKGKLWDWGGREDHVELPRCWHVYVISALDFSSAFAIPPFPLRSLNLCQAPCVRVTERGGGGHGWTLGPYCSPGGGGVATAHSVDGPPLYNPRPFPAPGFPPNTKQASPSISFLFRPAWVRRRWHIAPFTWHVY